MALQTLGLTLPDPLTSLPLFPFAQRFPRPPSPSLSFPLLPSPRASPSKKPFPPSRF
ncbi:hypothetical protein IE53DRAFT_75468 [Violaceomyces palustris]|uniref:Uncharacterized protein n=1 Tax=Violaceomyces palustris TaxID=1673888 RepID=A0ACD0NYH9_9BASI|nr:hypothetical protein IE53DRAFT_75468 [Violaceomyces palustris]